MAIKKVSGSGFRGVKSPTQPKQARHVSADAPRVIGAHNVRRGGFDRGAAPSRPAIGPVAGRRAPKIASQPSRVDHSFVAATTGLLHPLLPDLESYSVEVSAIFGTYNRIEHLKKAVASIRHACQGISYEIVVSDGGSTDGTQAWASQQADIRLLAGDLSGAVRAFNAAFAAAKGRIILSLNDDAIVMPEAVRSGLAYFADPTVGQVAFFYSVNGEEIGTQHVHGGPYVNYGMTRANVARVIASICGGFWAPPYYTYGADCELSLWVRRLGYKVAEAADARVADFQVKDGLRKRSDSVENGMSFRVLSKRWPNGSYAVFRGPSPGVTDPELGRLRSIEVGETPAQRWPRLLRVDPVPGQLPPRATPRAERILHVHLRSGDEPQQSMVDAFRSMGSKGYALVDWISMDEPARNAAILQAARQISPTLVFMQLHQPCVAASVLRTIRSEIHDPSLVLALWSGDVAWQQGPWPGFGDEWSHEYAKLVDVMLYSGTGQVEGQRARGMKNAAYLQIGYDEDRYFPGPEDQYGARHDVLFLAQNYPQSREAVPLHDIHTRRDAVKAFSKAFKRFGVYGRGWAPGTPTVPPSASGDLYRKSHMAISISTCSTLGRYTSDRTFRAMACGTPCLIKRFADMEGLGFVHGQNVLAFDTIPEAVGIAKDFLSPGRRTQLREIGRNGAALVQQHHTWGVRMHELASILQALRGQR